MVIVHKKILASEAHLMTRQTNEMNALKKKLEGRMNERLKLREQEHNKILQRYQNVKKEIENQQNIEHNKRERAYKTRPGTATQRSIMGASMSKMVASNSKMTRSKLGASQSSFNQKNPASKPSRF